MSPRRLTLTLLALAVLAACAQPGQQSAVPGDLAYQRGAPPHAGAPDPQPANPYGRILGSTNDNSF